MKILLTLPEAASGKRHGGVTTYSMFLAQRLAQLGHKVYYVTPGERNIHWQQSGYTVFEVNYCKAIFSKRFFQYFYKITLHFFPKFFERIVWAYQVYLFEREHGPFNIVESPEWGNGSLFISLFSPTKVVVRLHRSWLIYKKDNHLPITLEDRLVNLLELLTIVLANGVSSPTQRMFKIHPFVSLLLHRKKTKISIIPNGIPFPQKPHPTFSAIENSKITIIIVGRLEKAKGQFLVLPSLQELIKKKYQIQVVFVGEDTLYLKNGQQKSYKTYLDHEIHRYKLNHRVKIVGRKTGFQLKRLYQQASLIIVPSINNENQPMVILEALSFAKIILASNAGGIPELITGNNGLLFQQGNSQDLTDKLELLLNNNQLRKKLFQGALQSRNTYNIATTTKQTLNFYQSVLTY